MIATLGMTELPTGVIVTLITLGASNFLGLLVAVAVLNTRLEERHRENQRRFENIEHKLGNGVPGAFVRRDEIVRLVEKSNEDHERYEDEIAALRERSHEHGNLIQRLLGLNGDREGRK